MKVIKKAWGEEHIIVNAPEYCGKFLCVEKGGQSSYHYHRQKKETFYLMEGKVSLILEGAVQKLGYIPVTILPGQKHSFRGLANSVILEISTYHDDDDVVREILSQGGK